MNCFWLFVFYTMNKIMFFLVLCKFTKSLGTQSNLCLKIGTFITNPKTISIRPGTIPSFHPLSHQNSSPPSPTFSFVDTKKKTISLLCSPLMESEWPQTQTQNDYLILHLLLSLHPDCRIRLPSARLNSNNNNNKNNKGLRWEVCSNAGGCTVQDSAVCWPAFWGGHVDRRGSTPGRELNKSYEHCTWRWNSW